MLYNPGVSGNNYTGKIGIPSLTLRIVAGQWFVRKRATASGIIASGGALGGQRSIGFSL